MFTINVWLTVQDSGNVEKVRGLLTEAARLSGEEPGCERFEVYHSPADETRFLLCEHWATKEAWEVHRDAKAFQEIYKPQVLPLVEREAHVSTRVV